MKTSLTVFEVQQQEQQPRLFRFSDSEISIGFGQGCNLPLEPHSENGPELRLLVRSNGTGLLRAIRAPEKFQLNGTPCSEELPIKPGDIIASDSYRIRIRDLPGASPGRVTVATHREKPAGSPKGEAYNSHQEIIWIILFKQTV